MHWKNWSSVIKGMDGAGSGSAVFATLGVKDKDGDVILSGAIGQQTIKISPAHDWKAPNIGWGKTREEGDLAIVDFKLNLDMTSGKEWHSAMKANLDNGISQEWSFGFNVDLADFGDHNGDQVRFLKSLKIFEASPVMVGAGIATGTRSLKHENLTMEDQFARLIEDNSEFLDRSKALAALRLKEGRTLSRVNWERLNRLTTQLNEINADITGLLASTSAEPDVAGRAVAEATVMLQSIGEL